MHILLQPASVAARARAREVLRHGSLVSEDVRALHGAHVQLDILWLRVYRAFTAACHECRRAADAVMLAAQVDPLPLLS